MLENSPTEENRSNGGDVLDTESPLELEAGPEEIEERPIDEPLLYDAEAQQRIPVLLPVEGGLCEVTLIAVIRDLHMRRYATKVSQAMKEETEEAEQTAKAFDAFLELFDKISEDIEGFEEGTEKPDEWRDIFDPSHKSNILREWVFGVQFIEPQVTKKRPSWSANLKHVTTRMRVPFNGRFITTEHVLHKVNAKMYGEFASFLSNLTFRGSDAHMVRLAAWYDDLYVSNSGYKSSAIPLHHRSAVTMRHLMNQGAALRKNF
jgi:hypothetical protein